MENNQNPENLYTAVDDKSVLTLRVVKDILNKLPEDQLDFEMVVVEKLNTELRGIPVSNIILDTQGKQLTIFNFLLRNQLRVEAQAAQRTVSNTTPLPEPNKE